jgi:hypothetical protein
MKQRPLLFAALAWGIAAACPAFADPARVAVSGDPALADLVDVTAIELAKDPALNVLDRADLDKLGQEQEIQAVTNSQDFSGLHLLPADGLVLFRTATQDGKKAVFARLVAVQPGIVLREFGLPEGVDPTAQAQAIAKEFAPYWPKLAAIHKGNADALSLLGLRFEVDSPTTRDDERSINILLASRLGAEPDVVVLERWRLNDAVFEKAASPQQPTPFWTGSSLVDGNMRFKDGVIEVDLRLRPPHGDAVTFTDHDTPDNLAALAERLADKIHNHPASEKTWDAAAEASHYSELATWCLNNRLYEEGTQAVETAIALGDHSRATQALQVEAYTMAAFPQDLRILADSYASFRVAPESLPQRVAAATNAVDRMRDYLRANGDFTSAEWSVEDPVDLSVASLDACLRILFEAYENGFQANHPDDVAGLRHACQKLIADMDKKVTKPAAGQKDRRELRRFRSYLTYRIHYASLWNETPEATLAFYRENLSAGQDDGNVIRDEIFRICTPREPYLDTGASSMPAGLRPEPPWVVAWDGRSPEEVRTLWQKFIDELAGSPDLLEQCDAMKFRCCSVRSAKATNDVFNQYVAFLQNHPDVLTGAQRHKFFAGSEPILFFSGRKESGPGTRALVEIAISQLQHHALLPPPWLEQAQHLSFQAGTPDLVPDLYAALVDYSTWYQSQQPREKSMIRALTQARENIEAKRPTSSPLPVNAPTESLTVNRYWQPEVTSAIAYLREPTLDEHTLTVLDDTAYVMATDRPHKVYSFNTATLVNGPTLDIPPELDVADNGSRSSFGRYLEITPQWMVIGVGRGVLLYSRSEGTWKKLDVPPSNYQPRWLNGQLYLLYDVALGDRVETFDREQNSVGSGVIHVSLPDGACENLISSRRIPPQTPLDGQALGAPIALWADAERLYLALYDKPVYTSPLGKNEWTPVPDLPPIHHAELTPSGLLVMENHTNARLGQYFLQSGHTRSLVLSDDGPSPWKIPDTITSAAPGDIIITVPFLRGDDFGLYRNPFADRSGGKMACLVYFAKGQPAGVKIPLLFDPSQLKEQTPGIKPLTLLSWKIKSTSAGLLLGAFTMRGYWLIPWSDVDAYLASRATQAAK